MNISNIVAESIFWKVILDDSVISCPPVSDGRGLNSLISEKPFYTSLFTYLVDLRIEHDL